MNNYSWLEQKLHQLALSSQFMREVTFDFESTNITHPSLNDDHVFIAMAVDLDFDSGPGSHNVDVLKPYLNAIISFLNENRNMIIIDLGCGDFNVGSNLVKFSKKYIAIDVVGNLIDRNKNLFKSNRLIFKKIDVVYEDIPRGDCILIKEVFQHITNKEIKMILKKLINFKYLIITESEPKILNQIKTN